MPYQQAVTICFVIGRDIRENRGFVSVDAVLAGITDRSDVRRSRRIIHLSHIFASIRSDSSTVFTDMYNKSPSNRLCFTAESTVSRIESPSIQFVRLIGNKRRGASTIAGELSATGIHLYLEK